MHEGELAVVEECKDNARQLWEIWVSVRAYQKVSPPVTAKTGAKRYCVDG